MDCMEIADKNTERSTVITAVLTLIIIGVSLLVSTWQSMRHQQVAEEEHLFLTSRAVLLSVESSLRRGPVREGADRLTQRTLEFFQELEQEGDVLFAGIFDPQGGGRLMTSPAHGSAAIDLPMEVLQALFNEGSWHGQLTVGGRAVYAYSKRLGPSRGRQMGFQPDTKPPVFLIVGIDMERHLGAYRGYRQTALFQAGYILAAALFSWALAVSFLARRDQARRAAVLERFQAKLLDNLPDGLLTFASHGEETHIISANPAALSILQTRTEDLLGKGISALPQPLAACVTAHTTGESAHKWEPVTSGSSYLEVLILPLAEPGNQDFMMIVRDRTQLRSLEKSLADAEKLAVIGTLAAGVAHEVRNPLSALRGFAQYFVKKLSGKEPEESYAKTMVREADRLNRVITDLLFLGRPKGIAPVEIALAPLVEDIAALLRFDLEQKNIQITLQLDAPAVFADAEALKQALLNLLLNSLDALPPQTVAQPQDTRAPAADVPPDGQEAAPSPLPLVVASGYGEQTVWVEVRDTGCGMTPEEERQAFEPFFTAKEQGTGLGLALVQRTMLEHGGAASVTTSPGCGCVVRLEFPGAGRLPPHVPPSGA